jgi:RNA polymerase sigma-70 factor (ECF subfamily)
MDAFIDKGHRMSAADEFTPPGSTDRGEQQLIDEAKRGNHEAFRQLVERYMKQAYNVAYGFVNNHEQAEDIAQEAFVRVFQSLGSFRGEASFGTWLYRIVTNLSLNSVRHKKRKASYEMESFDIGSIPAGPSPDGAEAKDVAMHIERALHELPTLQRAVVILRHLNGLTTRQVSNILRCSEGTVKTHLHRGLKKMRFKLEFLKEA